VGDEVLTAGRSSNESYSSWQNVCCEYVVKLANTTGTMKKKHLLNIKQLQKHRKEKQY
jgi:hypothetical protein